MYRCTTLGRALRAPFGEPGTTGQSGTVSAARNESGSIQILLLGYIALVLAVIVTTVGATSLYLEKARLFALGDAAALSAAESFSLTDVHRRGDEIHAVLSDESVREGAVSYLRRSGQSAGFENLELLSARSPDGLTAEVRLRSTWRPPLLAGIIPARLPVEVTSRARVVFE